MSNTKRPLLRELIADVQIAVGKIQMQIENQSDKLDSLDRKFENHDKSLGSFNVKCKGNEQAIKDIHSETMPPIRKALYGLYTLVGVSMITLVAALIRDLLAG